MKLDRDHEDDASPPEMRPVPAINTGFAQVHDASRMRVLSGGRGNGLATPVSCSGLPSSADHESTRLGLEMKFPNLDLAKFRIPVKYRECLKNHAATLGGHALDGCGEFMPSGLEGTLEALKCAACDCHRNFHRREVEGEKDLNLKRLGAPLLSAPPLASPPIALMPVPPTHSPSQMIMALRGGPRPDFDDQDHVNASGVPLLSPGSVSLHSSGAMLRKRFRTKFTSEQKDKMWEFAEKLGWRIQKHDEQAVMQFCAETGVKRHVLKVWMHNNKNTLGKKPSL